MDKNTLELAYRLYQDILQGEGYAVEQTEEGIRPDRRVIMSAFRSAARTITESVATHNTRIMGLEIKDPENDNDD